MKLVIVVLAISVLVLSAASIISTGMLEHQTFGFAGKEITVNKTTTVDNDTTITLTCTENMKGLIASCG